MVSDITDKNKGDTVAAIPAKRRNNHRKCTEKDTAELVAIDDSNDTKESDDKNTTTTPQRKRRRNYRKYTAKDEEDVFNLVHNQLYSARGAASRLGLPPSTVKGWLKKERDDENAAFDDKLGSRVVGRPKGRPFKLTPEHDEFLKQIIEKDPTVTLKEMQDKLMKAFEGLTISKSGLSKHLKATCGMSLKRANGVAEYVDDHVPEA